MGPGLRMLLRLSATIPLVVLVVAGLFRLAPGARGLDLQSDSPSAAARHGSQNAADANNDPSLSLEIATLQAALGPLLRQFGAPVLRSRNDVTLLARQLKQLLRI